MAPIKLITALGFALVVAACASSTELEWLKVNQPYTAAEFRRDYKECEKTSKLEECLRSKGWVSVTAPNAAKQAAPTFYTPPGTINPATGRRN